MKKISNVFCLLVALSLYFTIFSDIANAQTYQFAHYGVPEGLPVSKVNSVIQTDNGVVWLATGVGLTLFNGNEFSNFGVNQGLYDQGVVVVLEDDNQAIWTGHYEGGLCKGDREGFQKIVLEDFDFQGDITAMSRGSDGSIWIGSMKQGLIQIKEIDKDTLVLSDYSVFSNNKKIESLVISIEEFNDSIFVLTERGIRVKAANDTTFSTYLVEGIPAYRRFVSMAASDDYLFLGDTKGSLLIVDGNRKIKSQIKLVEKRSPISSLIFDKKSGFWAGLRDGTLVNGDIIEGIKKTYTKENGLITGAIKTLLVDYEGNLLIGSYNTGLYIYKGNQFALFDKKNEILNNRVESICINSDDKIWLAGKDGISCIDTSGAVIQYTVENKGIPVNNIRLLASDCDGGIWAIANEYNVLHKKPDSKKFVEADDFKRYFFGMDKVVSLSNDNNGKLWLGTLTGLLIYDINEKKSKRFYQRDKLSGSIISAIACNENGNVFIGTQGNGLWSVSKELEFTQLLEDLTINTLELQGDGGMLLGSDVKGVLVWENGKIVDTINKQNNGLLANYITTICANEKLVLIGSASGLNVWNQQKDELYSFTAKSDFLGGEVLKNSIANSGDVFWIGTAKGAVRYIYKESGANILPPKVSIKKIRVNLEERELTQNLSFPYNENNFVFTYEGVCLTNPEAVKYSVRLKGLEETFTKPIELAEISYNNLPYGDYCFEVLSANDQGIWTPNSVTYNFTINPPFHAIIFAPVPCENSCPVDAIKKDENGIEHIDDKKCIHCGKCLDACPFGAIMEKSHLVEIITSIIDKKEVVALTAPALAGQLKAEMSQIHSALLESGFSAVYDVAEGADLTTQHEAKEFVEKMENGQPFMTTSCCASYTELVDKHLTEIKPFVSDTPTPMHYSAEKARRLHPNATIVFIAPCVSKRHEAFHDKFVDFVMNIEEMGTLFIAKNIDVNKCDHSAISESTNEAKLFALSGGVVEAVKSRTEDGLINPVIVNGIDKKVIREMKRWSKGKCSGNFVEVMSCEGGCVNGCNVIAKTNIAERQIRASIK